MGHVRALLSLKDPKLMEEVAQKAIQLHLSVRAVETLVKNMNEPKPEPVKKERSNILLALEKKMSEEFREYYVGKQVTALMEEAYEFEGETYFTGYTKEYVKIAVK